MTHRSPPRVRTWPSPGNRGLTPRVCGGCCPGGSAHARAISREHPREAPPELYFCREGAGRCGKAVAERKSQGERLWLRASLRMNGHSSPQAYCCSTRGRHGPEAQRCRCLCRWSRLSPHCAGAGWGGSPPRGLRPLNENKVDRNEAVSLTKKRGWGGGGGVKKARKERNGNRT